MIKSYVLSCVGAIIFLSFAEFMAPRGKNGNALRSVTAFIAVAAMVLPVISFLKDGGRGGVLFDDGYAVYERKITEKSDVYSVKTALKLNGTACKSVSIEYGEDNKIEQVLIFFDKTGIDGDDACINISEKAKETVSKTLNVAPEIVGVEFLSEGD